MGKQQSHGITWTKDTRQRSCLRPGDSLELSRQHSKVGSKVEIKIWFATQAIDSWDASKIAESGGPAAVITLGNLEQPGNRYSGGDSTLKTEAGTKPLASAGARPGLLAFQLSVFNGANSLLPKEVWLPCPITDHDKRTGMVVKVFVDGKEENLTRKLELLTRRMTWRQKLEALLKWQDKLVYGPPNAVRYKNGLLYSRKLWDEGGRIYYASASGERTNCYVCSPFANAFLAYWCNYHDSEWSRKVSKAGQSRELLVAAYKSFFEGEAPFARGPVPTVIDHTVAELNGLVVADRPGKYFKSSDAGDLVQGLPAPPADPNAKKKTKTPVVPKPLAVKAGQLVTWEQKKARWSVLGRLPSQEDWTFRQLYERLVDDEPGSIYVCGSTGHVWMMVVMGGAFTVPKKPVLGGGGDCEPGVYRIHASPAVPLEFGFTTYLKPEFVESSGAALGPRKKLIASLVKSLEDIATNKAVASNESAIPFPTIYANVKAALEKTLADKELDGLQLYGGTDLTMCNAKLSKEDNGAIRFDRGEAAPEPFRKHLANDETFKVWKLKRLIDDDTGWLKASHPDVVGDDFLKTLIPHDCRPIDSE